MVRVRAKVFEVGWGGVPHPRVSTLSCPSLDIYGPGHPSEARIPRPLAFSRLVLLL